MAPPHHGRPRRCQKAPLDSRRRRRYLGVRSRPQADHPGPRPQPPPRRGPIHYRSCAGGLWLLQPEEFGAVVVVKPALGAGAHLEGRRNLALLDVTANSALAWRNPLFLELA